MIMAKATLLTSRMVMQNLVRLKHVLFHHRSFSRTNGSRLGLKAITQKNDGVTMAKRIEKAREVL